MPHCYSHTRNNNIQHDLYVYYWKSLSSWEWIRGKTAQIHQTTQDATACSSVYAGRKSGKKRQRILTVQRRKMNVEPVKRRQHIISTVIINTLSKASIYQKVLQAKVMKRNNAAVLIMWYRQQTILYCVEPAELLTGCKVDFSFWNLWYNLQEIITWMCFKGVQW